MNIYIYHQNSQDESHRNAIVINKNQDSPYRRYFEEIPQENAISPNFQDAPHGSAIFLKIFKTLRTGNAILIIRERYRTNQFNIELIYKYFFKKSKFFMMNLLEIISNP